MNPAEPTPPPSLKEQSIRLLADYSALKAKRDALVAPFAAQVAIIQAEVAKETAPLDEKMEKIKAEAERIGLENTDAIFGQHHTSVIAAGYALKLSDGEAVACDNEEATIKRLLKEAGKAHIIVEPDSKEKDAEHAMAASACLRIKVELNKAYIQAMYDDFPEWFQRRGISLQPSRTVKLAEAPKPRTPKPKKEKQPKQIASQAQPEKEAA